MPGVFTYQFDNESFKGQVTINTGLFIDGQWVDGSEGTTIEYVTPLPAKPRLIQTPLLPSVLNPANGGLIVKVAEGTAKDVDRAVEAAHKAFDTTWGPNAPGYLRGALLNKLSDAIEAQYDAFCAVEALDNGPIYLI